MANLLLNTPSEDYWTMKKLMILGALIGFLAGIILGLMQGAPWPDVLWRATLACAGASFLFRWWGRVWLKALQSAQLEKLGMADLPQSPSAKL